MDLLRGIAVILVVLLHAADHGGELSPFWENLNKLFAPFRMPLLMFLSGLLLQRSLRKPMPVYLWGKFAAIVWPLMLWLAIYGLLVREGVGWPEDGAEYWRHTDYLWFLSALTFCYLVAGVLRWKPLRGTTVRRVFFLAMFAGMILGYVYGPIEGGLPGSTLWYGAFFFLGALSTEFVPILISFKWFIAVPLLIVVGLLAINSLQDPSLRLGTLTSAVVSALGIAAIIWVAPRVPEVGITRGVQWLGRNSIVVYVVHFPLIILARDHLIAPLNLPAAVHILSLAAIGLIGCVVAVWARPRTSWLYVFPGAAEIQHRLEGRGAL